MENITVIKSHEDFGNAIRTGRKTLGISQENLAGLYALSRYTLINAESGNGDPKFSTILTLLQGLGLSMVLAPSHLADHLTLSLPDTLPENQDQSLENWDPDLDPLLRPAV